MNINTSRLLSNLTTLSQIGRNKQGGIDRAIGSEADMEARRFLCSYWKEHFSLPVRTDAIANLWVRMEGSNPALAPIVVGSHHDAVPNGGSYDGAFGVLAATELMETFLSHGYVLRHPFMLVSFTGEEPNPYNVSTLGSKVLSGRLKTTDLKKLTSRIDGSPLSQYIEKVGGNIEKADDILIRPGQISAFIEPHVELGRRLYDLQEPSACVSCITGIYRENISILGDANHGGTTIMEDRRDALLAASEFDLGFEQIIKDRKSPEIVGTVGYLKVFPNEVSNIPGRVDFIMEIRTCEPSALEQILSRVTAMASEITQKRKVTIQRAVNLNQAAMPMDSTIQQAILDSMKTLSINQNNFVSMAGHDASNMQRVTRAGMIFAQSVDGKGHCPSEYTRPEDLDTTMKLLYQTIITLDKELD